MIRFEQVIKRYDTAVLDGITLSFAEGKITALLGASGRGKTTVLRLLAGLEKPESGSVSVDGTVGYLFQEPRLLPALTAFENVRLVCGSDAEAHDALALCCAEQLADKRPAEMSGGERQRVALARLVAYGGDVWLLDEPFSALDADTKDVVTKSLLPLMRARTVVLVTHDRAEAAHLADAVAEL